MARYLIDVNLPRYFSIWANDDCRFVADIDAKWTDTRHTLARRHMRMRVFHTFLSGRWSEICRLSENHRLVQVYHDRIECIE